MGAATTTVTRKQVGQILLVRGLLTQAQIDAAIVEQASRPDR